MAQAKGVDDWGLFTVLSSHEHLEWIPKRSDVSCGLIPRKYMKTLLDTKTVRGTLSFPIQVRILSNNHGVLKGMLVGNPGTDKIRTTCESPF